VHTVLNRAFTRQRMIRIPIMRDRLTKVPINHIGIYISISTRRTYVVTHTRDGGGRQGKHKVFPFGKLESDPKLRNLHKQLV